MEDVELVPRARTLALRLGPGAAGARGGRARSACRLEAHAAGRARPRRRDRARAAKPSEAARLRPAGRAAPSARAAARYREAGFELARVRAGRPRFGRDFGAQKLPAGGRAQAARGLVRQGLLPRARGRVHAREPRPAHAALARFEATADAALERRDCADDADGAAAGRITSAVLDPELGARCSRSAT